MEAVKLFDAGFTDLVSVIPPGVPIAPSSTIKPESRGKSPGVLYSSGMWGGYDWLNHIATREDANRIDKIQASIGIKAARFPAVDIDILDESLAAQVAAVVEARFPGVPRRVGLWPKRLYMFRLEPAAETFGRMQLRIGDDKHLVEILGDGQQYLIQGIHGKTNRPYEWQVPMPEKADQLPTITLAEAEALLDSIIAEVCVPNKLTYERAGKGKVAERGHYNQDSLKAADMDTLEAAIKRVPNTNDTFPTREDYIRFGYAVKGASQDDPDRGFRLFLDWAMKWEGNANGGNNPERVASDWERMRPPFDLGADYVYDVARQYGFDLARYEFPCEPAPPKPERPSPIETAALAQYSDMWLADRFVTKFGGRVRFCPQNGSWLAWDGNSWRADVASAVPGYVRSICVEVANDLLRRGVSERERKEYSNMAKSISSSRQMESLLRLARLDTRVITQSSEFDTNPDLLGTAAGVLDLRSGKLLDANPDMLISKTVNTTYNAEAKCPTWDAFVHQVTQGDEELKEYLQRISGYIMTGHTREQVFFFFHGRGGNGKGAFMRTIASVMGTYAKEANMRTFMRQKFESGTSDLASLVGARLVTAGELSEGQTWDEQRIKMLTGGDTVTARLLYQNEFSYVPTFKLLFAGNHKPHIESLDDAMRRRILLVPFNFSIQKRDGTLETRILMEAPGILRWMVEGAKKYYERGLEAPAIVKMATENYFENEDPITQFVREYCVVGKNEKSRFVDLYASWVDFFDKNKDLGTAPSQKKFGQSLAASGYEKSRNGQGQSIYVGLRLKKEPSGSFDVEEQCAA